MQIDHRAFPPPITGSILGGFACQSLGDVGHPLSLRPTLNWLDPLEGRSLKAVFVEFASPSSVVIRGSRVFYPDGVLLVRTNRNEGH